MYARSVLAFDSYGAIRRAAHRAIGLQRPSLLDIMEKVFDEVAEAVRTVESLIGERDARAVMEDAIDDLLACMDGLERSVHLSDEEAVRFSMHALIGLLSTFGFGRAERLSRKLLAADLKQTPVLEALRNEITVITSKLQCALKPNADLTGLKCKK